MTIRDIPVTGGIDPEVLGLLDIGVCLVDADLVVRHWNGAMETRNVPASEMIGKSLRQVLTPLCCARAVGELVAAVRAAVDEGRTTNFGHERALRFPNPLLPVFHVVCAPVEGRRQAAVLLKPYCNSETIRRQYERILDSTPDGIMVIDADRRVRIFNKACGELLGKNPQDVLRTSCLCSELVSCHMEDGTSLATELCPARELFQGEKSWQVQEMLTTNSHGEERWIETTYSSIPGDRGNIEFVIGIIRDVHERKLLEGRLHQTEKLAALGQLTAGIAHEIKNPLGIILSSVQIIMDEKRPREMQVEAATFIKEEVQRLDQRLRSFLEFARPHPPQPEPVVLNGVIRRTIHNLESAWKDVQIELQLSKTESIVQLDPHQFMQVITNLVLNSTEAMSGRGKILIRSRVDDQNIIVEMHDSGPGIGDQVRRKIFDPFFTTKASGTGLGLSIVFQIITAAEGRVEIARSQELGGAEFNLVLPIHWKDEPG